MADYDMFAFTVPQMFMNPIHLKNGLMWMADRCVEQRDEDGEIGGDRSGRTPELIGFTPNGLTPCPFTVEKEDRREQNPHFFPLIIVFTCQGGITSFK